MWDGKTLQLGEAGLGRRGLPHLQSLLHTFQQAPATGRPLVFIWLRAWIARHNGREEPKGSPLSGSEAP